MRFVAVTAKEPTRQISPHLVDVANFWEISQEVGARPEDRTLDLVVMYLSLQRGYPVHALLQDWILGIGMRV
jgi:hypothetical protein